MNHIDIIVADNGVAQQMAIVKAPIAGVNKVTVFQLTPPLLEHDYLMVITHDDGSIELAMAHRHDEPDLKERESGDVLVGDYVACAAYQLPINMLLVASNRSVTAMMGELGYTMKKPRWWHRKGLWA